MREADSGERRRGEQGAARDERKLPPVAPRARRRRVLSCEAATNNEEPRSGGRTAKP